MQPYSRWRLWKVGRRLVNISTNAKININMTQEEQQLLHQDLCGRLPYGVLVSGVHHFDICFSQYICEPLNSRMLDIKEWNKQRSSYDTNWYSDIRPYLRPMSNMTEEESKVFALFQTDFYVDGFLYPIAAINMINWLNEHHFDYCGLIEKGLAIEAPEGMYKKD